jgi:hypothetical protein
MKNTDLQQASVQTANFMLAEYEHLKDFRASMISQMESRLNFLFASVSGIAAVLALISQITGVSPAFFVIALSLTFLLFLLGSITFARLVEGHISLTLYTRGINRIRRFFVDNDDTIKDYILLPVTDDVPKFGILGFSSTRISITGNVGMTLLLNTIIFGCFFALLINLVLARLSYLSILAVFLASMLVWFAQLRYYDMRTKKVEKATISKFPSESGG